MFIKTRRFLGKFCISVLITTGTIVLGGVFCTPVSAATHTAEITTPGSISILVQNGISAVTTSSIKVKSTCPTGYILSISGPDDNTLYKDGDGASSHRITASSGTISSPAVLTGDKLGTWGYSLTNNSATGPFTGLTYNAVEIRNQSSASADEGDDIPIYYGASAKISDQAGTYTMTAGGSISYYLVNNISCTSYIVQYDANGGTGSMEEQRIGTGTTTSLTPNTFTPPTGGYTFANWNTKADGTGATYADGESITDIVEPGETIVLYAQYKYEITFEANGGSGTMEKQTIIRNKSTTLNANTFTAPVGYEFDTWNTKADGTGNNYNNQASVSNLGSITLYAKWKPSTYTVSLNANGGTGGSTSTTATYGATTLAAITNPTRANTTATRTVSGFTAGTNASGATISSTTTLNSTSTTTYTFNGWYKESGATNKIASNATTPALQVNTSYTNASSQWTSTSSQTLYAGWTASAGVYTSVTLPTITKAGYTCGWATSSTATNYTYNSGASFTPTANTTLYGVCKANTYTITLNANGGTGGSTSTTATYGATTLAAITNPTRANTTATRTVSGFTKTTSATNSTVSATTTLNSTSTTTYTFNGWYKESGATNKIASNATTPALQASTSYTNASSQWTSTSNQTLYAGWTSSTGSYSSVTLPTITRTGSTCGWATSSTATTWNYNSGASITPTGNLTLYGVCRNNITLNANGGTGGSTSTTVNYNATTLGTITNPTRANTTATRTVSGFTAGTNASGATISSTSTLNSTATVSYTFNGWYKESGATNKIASNATTPALEASTTYTNASKQWTYTTAGAVTLYAGWTSSTGSYSSVTLPTITKTGYTCGWTTTSTGATSINYASGTSFTPTANTTLYGVCLETILDTGQTVNQKLKRLAGNSSATDSTTDRNITALARSDTLPSDFTPSTANTISTTNSGKPIYAWYNSTNKTIYYYSESTTIKMNQSSSYFFYEMRALSDLSTISSWDTSSVTYMSRMFNNAGYNATTFTLDLSSWNTSSVTDMSNMFYQAGRNATTWSIGDLSSWNTSKVRGMSDMFNSAGYSATTFTLDLSSWDTSSVTTMYYMFSGAGYNATTWSIGDLSSWNTSKVRDMSDMFLYAGYRATTFTLDLSSWDTSSVTNMPNMFEYAGYSATTWSVTIPKTNKGSTPITNTTTRLYGNTTSVSAAPPSGRTFTLAN